MRGVMDGDVAAERQLNAIKDLLEVLPRSRGFRVSLDGNVSVYPATQDPTCERMPKKRPRGRACKNTILLYICDAATNPMAPQ